MIAKIFGMRKTISAPSFLGSTDIGAIKPNAKSRDDISALLIGFQATYADGAVRFIRRHASFRAAAWTLCVRVQHFWTVRCPICLRPKTVCRIRAGCFPAVRILHKTTSGDSFALIDTGCHSPKAT